MLLIHVVLHSLQYILRNTRSCFEVETLRKILLEILNKEGKEDKKTIFFFLLRVSGTTSMHGIKFNTLHTLTHILVLRAFQSLILIS